MLAFNIVLGIILLVSFLLILVIMVQQPKSGGLSSAFGGNAQVVGGVKKLVISLTQVLGHWE